MLFMLEQLEELIQLRQNHDPGPAVELPAVCRAVVRYRHILAATRCRHMRGLEPILLLKDMHHGGRALDAEVPVVEEIPMTIGNVVRMTFDHKLDVRLRL